MSADTQREAVARTLCEHWRAAPKHWLDKANEIIAAYEAADPELGICEECGKTYAECNAAALLRLEDAKEQRLRTTIAERDQLRADLAACRAGLSPTKDPAP